MVKKLTVYQKITHMLGNEASTPTYVIDPNQFKNIQGDELENKKLEAQQTLFLQSQWKKIDNELYQKAVYYEPTRIASYYDYEAMEYCLHGDTQIATPQGFTSLKDLVIKYGKGDFIVYSYDHNLQKVVPAVARNAHYTRDEMTYKITFDDGKFIIATWEHRLMKRDSTFAKVSELKVGDSMMPFYRKSFYNNEKYNWIYTCNSNEGHHGWVSEHNMIAEWYYGRKIDNKVEEVHHIDFNGKNNLPENLKIMSINEHRGYHARLNNEKLWTNPEYRAKMLEIGKRTDNKHHWNGARSGKNNPTYKPIPFDLIIDNAKKYKTLELTSASLKVSATKLKNDIKNAGYDNWLTFLTAYGIEKHCNAVYKTEYKKHEENSTVINHKIISIEPYGIVPVYDLTVPGYKNFATDSIFSHNTPEIAVALDIFADEATVADDHGNILQIYSENTRIKDELTDLFINKLDANTNLTAWARNLPIKHDSVIPLLNGEDITIKEISERLKNNPEIPLYTYAIQDETQDIVAGKIVWCDLTRKDCDIIRVYLDDNTYVETAPDHEFMLRNGNYKRADKLSPNDSLMPYYTRISEKPKDIIRGYEKIYNPSSNYFKYTHRVVSEHLKDCVKEKGFKRIHTHHVDFNKLNNNPENLIRLPDNVHLQIHRDLAREVLHDNMEVVQRRMDGIDRFLRSDKRKKRMSEEMKGFYPKYFEIYNNSSLHSEHNQIRTLSMLYHWSNDEYKEKTRERMTIKLSDVGFEYIANIIQNSENYIGIYELCDTLKSDQNFNCILQRDNAHFRKNLNKSINPTTLSKIIKRQLNLNYFDWLLTIKGGLINNNRFNCAKLISEHNVKNHKVLRTELLPEKHDVYCMEIRGLRNETDRHNFPVCSKNTSGGFSRNGVFVSNCKYGDNFVYLKIIPKEGVIGVTQLPNVEITRSEPGFTKIASYDEQKAQKSTQFFWRDKNIEFNSFEVAHFRLTGDDRRMPYGTCLKSDSLINTYEGAKEIKDIKNDDIVLSFDLETQTKQASKVLDVVNSGFKEVFNISTKHNFIEASKEHKILVYNGGFQYKNVLDLTIGDLLVINKEENKNHQIPIDKTTPINYDETLKKSHKNHYWKNIDKIPDYVDKDFAELFGFLLGDGTLDIKRNTVSFCMGVHEGLNQKYIDILNKFSGNINLNIRANSYGKNFRVYSKSLLTILQRMGFAGNAKTKRLPSWIFGASKEIKEALIRGLFNADGSIYIDKWDCARYSIELANEPLIKDVKYLLQTIGYKTGKISSRTRKKLIINGGKLLTPSTMYRIYYWETPNKQTNKYDITERLSDDFIVEPIISIESIGEHETYDIYVENENHNFYANGIVVHNSMLEKARRIWKQLLLSEDAMLVYRTTRAPERRVFKIFVGNMDDKDVDSYVDKIANNFKRVSMSAGEGGADTRYNPIAIDQDYFIPVRDPQLTMPIETLPGAQNLGEISDVEFIQKKLIMAMRIPKAFIGFEEITGDGKNLAILDVRFARAVQRLQKAIIQELNKIAIIHLYLRGFEDDLHNFTLSLQNPSTQALILKIETWKEKVSLYRDAVSDAGNGYAAMSMTMAKKEFFNMSEEEIKLDVQRQAIERAGSEELKMIAETIKQTGIFGDVYRMYGINPNNMMQDPNEEGGDENEEGFEPAGGIGGEDFSTSDMGDMGDAPDMGGAGGEPTGETGLGGLPSGENIAEAIQKGLKTYNTKMRMRAKQMLNEINKTAGDLKL